MFVVSGWGGRNNQVLFRESQKKNNVFILFNLCVDRLKEAKPSETRKSLESRGVAVTSASSSVEYFSLKRSELDGLDGRRRGVELRPHLLGRHQQRRLARQGDVLLHGLVVVLLNGRRMCVAAEARAGLLPLALCAPERNGHI
jgi:hypothetical protein